VGTTMRIFPMVTFLQQKLFNIENSLSRKPIIFDIHPNEFIQEQTGKRTIARRTKNPVSYFLSDFLRSRLKVRNLGLKAIPLYERFINYYKTENYTFVTAAEYLKIMDNGNPTDKTN
jgi:peptidoglycan-N-acetylglucosamine deacetylase